MLIIQLSNDAAPKGFMKALDVMLDKWYIYAIESEQRVMFATQIFMLKAIIADDSINKDYKWSLVKSMFTTTCLLFAK